MKAVATHYIMFRAQRLRHVSAPDEWPRALSRIAAARGEPDRGYGVLGRYQQRRDRLRVIVDRSRASPMDIIR